MPILQMLLTLIMLIVFITVIFLIAWYVAIPLLLVWAVFGGIRWLRDWIVAQRELRAANGCSLKRSHTKTKAKTTVIDVDYTEV